MESIGNTTIQTLEPANYDSQIDQIDNETHIFNGTPQLTVGYSYISTMIKATANGVLYIRHSMDGETWDIIDTIDYPGTSLALNTGLFNMTPAKASYVSVRFVNSALTENSIRLQTFMRNDSSSASASLSSALSSSNSNLNLNLKYVFEQDIRIASPATGWSLDFRERPGWYFSGSVESTLKWYNGPTLQFGKATGLYIVATLDSTAVLPTMQVKTGVTTWTYSLPAASNIYTGETYLFYYGSLETMIIQGAQPLALTRTQTTGPGADTEPITEINIVATAGSKFLVKSSGIWNQTLSQPFSVSYETVPKQLVSVVEDTYVVRDLTVDSSYILSAAPALTADIRGREGWWSSGQTDALIINMYLLQGNNGKPMRFTALTGMYIIIIPDDVGVNETVSSTSYIRLPTIKVQNNATPTPLTCNYRYMGTSRPRPCEPIMLYVGNIPADVHKSIPRYELSSIDSTAAITASQAAISNIKIELASGTACPLLLTHSGYIDSDLGRVNETRYVSGNKRKIDTNLSALTVTPSGALLTSIRDASNNAITSKVSGDGVSRGLDVNVLNTTLNYNEAVVVSGTLTPYSISGFSWARGAYGNKSVLSYRDSSTTVTDTVSLFSASGSNNLYLGSAYPINISGVGRQYCFNLNLLPFDNIQIRNDSSLNINEAYAVLRSA